MIEEIERQRKEVFGGEAKVKLFAPCTVESGIIRLTDEEKKKAVNDFAKSKSNISFFIPASGSGSRMFQFLHENNEVEIERLREKFPKLALSQLIQNATDKTSIMQFACLPKGLIPFHQYGDSVRTAFQEHVCQAKLLLKNPAIHFTIQKEYESEIKENLSEYADVSLSYSYQNPETDAYCFNANEEVVEVENKPLRRPAGHGALLENMNRVDADILFIKNIDNIQHESKSALGIENWKIAGGLLHSFQDELRVLADNFTKEGLIQLNNKYGFLSADEVENCDHKGILHYASRPSRVCGMVINEGEPGGGPFWVESNSGVSKQIVEKVQISNTSSQLEILQQSTHFNPVFIALSKKDVFGNVLDLQDFKDESSFIVVCKSQNGKDVYYRELPGLWNGGMSDWNTVFFEIPSSTFSPVKTLLDLAKSPHQPS